MVIYNEEEILNMITLGKNLEDNFLFFLITPLIRLFNTGMSFNCKIALINNAIQNLSENEMKKHIEKCP